MEAWVVWIRLALTCLLTDTEDAGAFHKERADGEYGTVVRQRDCLVCRGEYSVLPGRGGALDVRERPEVARSDTLQ